MPRRAPTAAKVQANRDRQVTKLATAELMAGGALSVEACDATVGGRPVGGSKRWRLGNAILGAGEALALDPRHLPPGTELAVVRPGSIRWPLECWMLHDDVAMLLLVSKKRLYNLMALHKLERRIQWVGRPGKRRRISLLPPATCRRLGEVTGRAYMITPPS